MVKYSAVGMITDAWSDNSQAIISNIISFDSEKEAQKFTDTYNKDNPGGMWYEVQPIINYNTVIYYLKSIKDKLEWLGLNHNHARHYDFHEIEDMHEYILETLPQGLKNILCLTALPSLDDAENIKKSLLELTSAIEKLESRI